MERSGSGFVCNIAREDDLSNKTSVVGSKDILGGLSNDSLGGDVTENGRS